MAIAEQMAVNLDKK